MQTQFSLKYLIAVSCTIIIFFFSLPVPSAYAQTELTPLTIEILEQRINTPILRDGKLTVDLRNMEIDLRPQNGNFRDLFYQKLQQQLQKKQSQKQQSQNISSQTLGLDLSHSLIKGDFLGSNLGFRTSLYSQAIAPILTLQEQEQLGRLYNICLDSIAIDIPLSKDCRSLFSQSTVKKQPAVSSEINIFRGYLILAQTHFEGKVQFANTFFLQSVDAEGAVFQKNTNWAESRFSRGTVFSHSTFQGETQFQGSIFLETANFKQSIFQNIANFQNIIFTKSTNFKQAVFADVANFQHIQWQGYANFENSHFRNQIQFSQDNFDSFLFLNHVTFDQTVTFREAKFNQPVNLRSANIIDLADFSDAEFALNAYLNISGLAFNSNRAKLLGNPDEIGKKLVVSELQGNANVLRNLIQNFRQLQQIADANQLEYRKQRLQLIQLHRRLLGKNINSASPKSLINLGFSQTQAESIIHRRLAKPFRNKNELLAIADIDPNMYARLNSRVVISEEFSVTGWLILVWKYLTLASLLLLSGYGTNFWLVVGIGIIITAHFGLLFWFVDRFRRLHPKPIIPTSYETISMLVSFNILLLFGFFAIFDNTYSFGLTIGYLTLIIVPFPSLLIFQLYKKGRFHNLMDVSYFSEDGTLRQLRLLIGRLPVIPRYQLFRERFMPLLWERRWNWLNYYDFSLNNLLKIGFNDVRLRDEDLPGIISTMAWYQWSLGILYITLLLWTLSRTIPGLNLLFYLK
ncbi:pentapeptide repeat-containing protein [Mastigocoleus testarum]|uniref:Low-complexity protein n=1 Tax=Mastigocoleus testarum BC008 TaxID=371196 RepID=A0A0V7ZU21_9CYAN|nr:pentapeptide repeat-containing protein [Mastigocoleus testarum]KST67686.1 low-complexity protein [Mastigocoleus testarum BC008]